MNTSRRSSRLRARQPRTKSFRLPVVDWEFLLVGLWMLLCLAIPVTAAVIVIHFVLKYW